MASALTILRRLFSAPLLQLGGLAFDAEVSVSRGGQRQYTDRRVGAGTNISDHSFRLARIFTVEGAVSGLPQKQNIGRPGSSILGGLLDIGLSKLEGLTGLDFATRVADFEARMQGLIESGEEMELVSKVVGRQRVILLDWSATTTADMGDQGVYRCTCKEVLRAGLSIADATAQALALNGSGGAPAGGGGGPSVASPSPLNAVS